MVKSSDKKANPTLFLIFGGTGDLTKRKIMPALYNLFLDNWLPEKFAIIGTSWTEMNSEKYKSELLSALNQFSRKGKTKKEDWLKFSSSIT
ncbi:MAG: glucose-6-phosphate dehydrogenase, partial [Aquaticitalea sp.]